MSGKRSQKLIRFPPRNLEKCKRAPELGCNFIELGGRSFEATVGKFQAQRRTTGFRRGILEGSARNIADPKCSHELEAREPFQAVRVPFSQGNIFRVLTDDGVEDELIAEVVDDRGDSERPAEPVIEVWFRH
jgi:hypothetical protein